MSGWATAHYLPGSRTGPAHRALCRSAPGSGPRAQSRHLAVAPVPAREEEKSGPHVTGLQRAWGKGTAHKGQGLLPSYCPQDVPLPQDLPGQQMSARPCTPWGHSNIEQENPHAAAAGKSGVPGMGEESVSGQVAPSQPCPAAGNPPSGAPHRRSLALEAPRTQPPLLPALHTVEG